MVYEVNVVSILLTFAWAADYGKLFCVIKHSRWSRITKDILIEQDGLPIASISRRLVREAIRERRCKDNCTAIVIVFRPKW